MFIYLKIKASTGSSTTVNNYSNKKVSTLFDMDFNLKFGTSAFPGSYIVVELPTYDNGFISDANIVTCKIKDSSGLDEFYVCVAYQKIDWILIYIHKRVYYTRSPRIYLQNLRWPRISSQGTSFSTSVTRSSSSRKVKDIKSLSLFAIPTPNSFNLAKISAPKKGLGEVDCTYKFYFKAQNEIPNGGEIRITFPTGYSLLSSYPSPRFYAPQFKGVSSISPLTFTPSISVLKITNIADFPANAEFTVIVEGIKNPSFGATSTGKKNI